MPIILSFSGRQAKMSLKTRLNEVYGLKYMLKLLKKWAMFDGIVGQCAHLMVVSKNIGWFQAFKFFFTATRGGQWV